MSLDKWKSGKYVAKIDEIHSDISRARGNFESECIYLTFMSSEGKDWVYQNEEHLKELLANTKEMLELRRRSLLDAIDGPEIRKIYRYLDEKSVNEAFDAEIAELDNDADWLFEHKFSKLYDCFWMTWNEFEHEMFEINCVSGFEHEDKNLEITAIGKYNHT